MIYPDTELRLVSEAIGYGVFATRSIPRGTVTYVRDALEIELTRCQFDRLDATHRQIVDKYSYIDPRGRRIVSWDHARYVNHRCECNTISTGYGFEIAIRDIAAGEEITDEYGLFNLETPMVVDCGCRDCRRLVRPDDPEHLAPVWVAWVIQTLALLTRVEQPLWHLVDPHTRREVQHYLAGTGPYRYVACLRWRGRASPAIAKDGTGTCPALSPAV